MPRWTELEDNILLNKYVEYGTNIPELIQNHTKDAIRKRAQYKNIKCDFGLVQQKQFNHNFFDELNNTSAYVLGYWFADGSVSKSKNNTRPNINISSKDYDMIIKLRDALESNHNISTDKNTGVHRLTIRSLKLLNSIRKYLNNPYRKSFTIRLPKLPVELYSHFLRGYFDGDGCIVIRNKNTKCSCVSFASNSKEMLKDINNLLPFNGRIYSRTDKHSTRYQLMYNKENSKRMLEYMYKDADIYLDRKYERAKTIIFESVKELREKNE